MPEKIYLMVRKILIIEGFFSSCLLLNGLKSLKVSKVWLLSSIDFTMISSHKIITIASGIFPSVTGNITAEGDTASVYRFCSIRFRNIIWSSITEATTIEIARNREIDNLEFLRGDISFPRWNRLPDPHSSADIKSDLDNLDEPGNRFHFKGAARLPSSWKSWF